MDWNHREKKIFLTFMQGILQESFINSGQVVTEMYFNTILDGRLMAINPKSSP
jgi:hypothetical protein